MGEHERGRKLKMVLFNNIPEIMRELNHWVLWTKDKAPHQISGKLARSNDPNTWSNFSNVLKCYDSKQYQGIGFMFTGSGITGIDIDHCIEDGRLSTLAEEIIDICNSYTEKSPSGKGIHIYMQGVVPKGIKKEIEMYSEGRYFTVTGDKLNDLNVESRQIVLDQLYKKYSRESFTGTMTYPKIRRRLEPGLSDDEILQRAFNNKRNGSKIKALYDGDMNGYGNDHSAADLALCGYLAPWLDRDFDRINRAITNSGLYRDKWDRPDYKLRTISRAIAGCDQSLEMKTIKKDIIRNIDEKAHIISFEEIEEVAAAKANEIIDDYSEFETAQEQLLSDIYDMKYLEYVDFIISQMDSDEDSSNEESFYDEEEFCDADAFSYEDLIEEEYLIQEEQEFTERSTIEDIQSFDFQFRLIAREYEENFTEPGRIPKIGYLSNNAIIEEHDLWLEDEVLDDQLLVMNDTDLQQLAESYAIYADLQFQEDNYLNFIAFAKDLQHEQDLMEEQSSVYYDALIEEDDLGLEDEVLDNQLLIVNDTNFQQLAASSTINKISSDLQFEEDNYLDCLAEEVQEEQELMYIGQSSVYYDEQCRNIMRIISILNTVDTSDKKINTLSDIAGLADYRRNVVDSTSIELSDESRFLLNKEENADDNSLIKYLEKKTIKANCESEADTLPLHATEQKIGINQQQGEQITELQQQMNNLEELISKTKSVNKKQEQETDLKAEVLLESTKTEKTSWWRRFLRKFF